MRILAAIGIAAFTLAASPPEMTAGTFMATMKKLEAQGMTAIFSSDAGKLKAEIERVNALYRGQLARETKEKRVPHSCPPPKGKAKLSSDEIKTYFNALSAQQLKLSYRTNFFAMMAKKYPCK